ncbi:MAG: phosphoadenylyl-sulfate reductase [Pseudomonadota bacterium]
MTAQVIPLSSAPADNGESLLNLRARSLAARFVSADAREVLAHAIQQEFKSRIALVSSFGAESAALLHLVSEIDPATPVVFLDTQKHFAQTLSYRKKLAARLGLTNVIDVRPNSVAVKARDADGDLWKSDPDACCTLRKVEPLGDALEPFDAWITGRKQFHGGGRMGLPAFEANDTHIKVNPLIRWSKDDVAAYATEHDLPPHPLVAQGYPSIGCWPCTHPVASGEDVRAGRWRGAAKTECGIHGVALEKS